MKTKSKKKYAIPIIIALLLVFTIPHLNTYAYATPFGTCQNLDCASAVPGQIRPGTSSFPYASWDMHQRHCTVDFICDNCKFEWSEDRFINENHEFVNRRCECGYVAH